MEQIQTDKVANQGTSFIKMADIMSVLMVFMVTLTHGLENHEIKPELSVMAHSETSEVSATTLCYTNCL